MTPRLPVTQPLCYPLRRSAFSRVAVKEAFFSLIVNVIVRCCTLAPAFFGCQASSSLAHGRPSHSQSQPCRPSLPSPACNLASLHASEGGIKEVVPFPCFTEERAHLCLIWGFGVMKVLLYCGFVAFKISLVPLRLSYRAIRYNFEKS